LSKVNYNTNNAIYANYNGGDGLASCMWSDTSATAGCTGIRYVNGNGGSAPYGGNGGIYIRYADNINVR